MTCAQGLLRLLWGGPKLECYGTDINCEQVQLLSTLMLETGKARRCQELQKLWRLRAILHNISLIDLILERELTMSKKHQLFIAALTNINWVKPVQRSDPIFITLTLTMSGSLIVIT